MNLQSVLDDIAEALAPEAALWERIMKALEMLTARTGLSVFQGFSGAASAV
ncbi:MAG: hypothetical protein QM586_09095 [Xenophilus sp.]